MTIHNNERPRGKGYWKLNVSILNDEAYVIEMNKLIENSIEEHKEQVSNGDFWEFLELRIKEFSRKDTV